jgi:hypothetical protein
MPLIVSLIVGIPNLFAETSVPHNDLKATLNALIDWPNSFYIIGKNNAVRILSKLM